MKSTGPVLLFKDILASFSWSFLKQPCEMKTGRCTVDVHEGLAQTKELPHSLAMKSGWGREPRVLNPTWPNHTLNPEYDVPFSEPQLLHLKCRCH